MLKETAHVERLHNRAALPVSEGVTPLADSPPLIHTTVQGSLPERSGTGTEPKNGQPCASASPLDFAAQILCSAPQKNVLHPSFEVATTPLSRTDRAIR